MTKARVWPAPEPPRAVSPGLVKVANLNATGSPGFTAWLARTGAALLLTSGDRLLAVAAADDELELDEQRADVAMGMAAAGPGTVHLATRWQLHRLEDAGADGERQLVNQLSWTTGFVAAYDVAVEPSGRVLFTNALCNCVATPGDRTNFRAVHVPWFISELVAEERCHVTGLALDEDGELAYVTCASESDEAGGWQAALVDGGAVIDVRVGRTLARGLSLPCSPRIHEGRLYVANAGTGELLKVDRESGAVSTVVRLPGLVRGLTFLGGRALVGCSVPPDEGPYVDLPISRERLAAPRHGLAVVDVDSGTVEHTLTIEAGSGDLFAVEALPDTRHVTTYLHSSQRDALFRVAAAPDVVG